MQHPMTPERLGVVLDAHRGGFGGAQSVDAEEERQSTVVNGQRLGDLQEADELEPVESWVRDSSCWNLGSRA